MIPTDASLVFGVFIGGGPCRDREIARIACSKLIQTSAALINQPESNLPAGLRAMRE